MRLFLSVLLLFASLAQALAGSFSYGTAIPTGNSGPLFNGNSRAFATNARGTIFTYQASTTGTAYQSQREVVLWWAGDPMATSPVTLLDVTGIYNPPCVAATSTGEFWVAVGNWVTNAVTVYRWANVSVSTTPSVWQFFSDQAGNGKWSCAYDEMRRKFYFIGTGFALLSVDDSGNSTNVQLTTQSGSVVPTYYAEYPNIQVGDDGHIDLAWTTVDTTFSTPQYRGIYYMQSPNGGSNWSVSGLSGSAWIASPPAVKVIPNENGPALAVHWYGELLPMNTWLSGMAAYKSALHFSFMVIPTGGAQCLNNDQCTVAEFVFERHPSGIAPSTTWRPFRGSNGSVLHGTPYTQLVTRGSDLYLLAAGTGTLAAYHLNASGSWDQVSVVDPRGDAAGTCVSGLAVDLSARTSTSILGAVAVSHVACSGWGTAAITTPTDVVPFQLTLP